MSANGIEPEREKVTSAEGRAILAAVQTCQSGILEVSQSMGELAAEQARQGDELRDQGRELRKIAKSLEEGREKLDSVPDLDAIEQIAEKTGRTILKGEAKRLVRDEKLRELETKDRKRAEFWWKVAVGVLGLALGFGAKVLASLLR